MTASTHSRAIARQAIKQLRAEWENPTTAQDAPTAKIQAEKKFTWNSDRAAMMDERDYLAFIKRFAARGNDIHKDNELYLRWATDLGYLKIVRFLVEDGADIHAEKDDALLLAAKNGHLEIVRFLIEKGIDIHTHDDFALVFAAEYNHLDTVRYLVENGIDNNKYPALLVACQNGHLETVRYLVENGAKIHSNCLMYAANFGRLDVVRCLVENGAEVKKNYDALWRASEQGHFEIVKLLVENGASISMNWHKALREASDNGHFEVMRYLIEQGSSLAKLTDEKQQNYEQFLDENYVPTLTESFKAATWVGHAPEMTELWQEVPPTLQNRFDFQHLLSDVTLQTLKQQHKPKITLTK